MLKVVYIEDDVRLADLTSRYLRSHSLEVHVVNNGRDALTEVMRVSPDVVLLDLMLPLVDGVQVCKLIRERSDVPIVMVTARGEEPDRVLGLEVGADDYVLKPFSTRELLARIRAQARRSRGLLGPRSRLEVGSLVMDLETMSATLADRELTLTTSEYALLRALAERPGRVLSRDQLMELVHGSSEEVFDRSIDVHISRLRQKLGDDSRRPQVLKTVRGAGYMLSPGRAPS